MMGRGRGRGGRGRFGGGWADEPRRSPPRRSSGWGVAPPSRHLWVGSLGPSVAASDLAELFLRYGEVEGIARDPGRSFALVDFRREEDAVAALDGLQGAILGGGAIKIEFSKGDGFGDPASITGRASGGSVDDRYTQYDDERHFVERRRVQPNPEKSSDKSKRNRSTEPSEVLWIGFPSNLHVDETTLREAFLPFGEMVKITTFPGRSYAFVQYTTTAAAYRAKEALQGKLFNDSRVTISFARSEGVAAEVGKRPSVGPNTPHINPSFQPIFGEQDFEAFPRGRPFGSPRDFHMSSPTFGPKRLSRDVDDMHFSRNNYLRQGPGIEPGPVANFEHARLRGLGPERRMSEDLYEQCRNSPTIGRGESWHHIPFEQPRRPLPSEGSWDVEDNLYPLSKKPRPDQVHDTELPEYPFSEFNREKIDAGYSRSFHELPEEDGHRRNYHYTPIHGRSLPDPLGNPTLPLAERHESWRAPGSFATHSAKAHGSTPEHHQPLKEEWKWEGTIAKGGTPICRARCFPVGKVLNFMLPELLNCTARTDLEMLAKHYYQAASSWVVFFVPENDADMAFYNEFMNYLGDKQRAAVCKLGERITLFLVPPSEFSEKVLRVPGKVSISGVILKFEQPNSDFNSPHHQLEVTEKVPPSFASHLTTDVSSHEDPASLRRLNPPDNKALPHQGSNYLHSSAGSYTPASSGFFRPYPCSHLPQERPPPSESCRETAEDQYQQPSSVLPSGGSNNMNVPYPGSGNFSSAQGATSHTLFESTPQPYPFGSREAPRGMASGHVATEALNTISLPSMQPPSQQVVRPQQPPSLPISLQPEQMAHLATLLAQQSQRGTEAGLPVDSSNKQSSFIQNPNPHGHASMMDGSGAIRNQYSLPPAPPSVPQLPLHVLPIQAPVPPAPPVMLSTNAPIPSHATSMHALVGPAHSFMPSSSFFPPLPEGAPILQHMPSAPPVQPVVASGHQTSQQLAALPQDNQQLPAQEEDPQVRLQATLQLAATLLQKIQQQARPGGQQ